MRSLPHYRKTNPCQAALAQTALPSIAFLVAAAWIVGCFGGCASSGSPPPPPPPPSSITVTVAPNTSSVLLGNTQAFTATVTNTTDTQVAWSVNGNVGGNAAVGTITADGVFTAPADLPSPVTVRVTAASHADSTKSASASVTITSDITVGVTPASTSVELGATQKFHAAVTSAGHPDTQVRWGISGAACPSGCGTVDTTGNYTAPQILPSPANVTLTAQSAADSAKQASVNLIVTSSFSLQLTAPASVPTGTSATVVALLTPVPGSNPSGNLSWTLSGTGCSGAACGTLTSVTTQASGGTVLSGSATYTAPGTAPNPNTIVITVIPQADPTKAAQAVIVVPQGIGVSVSPSTATLAANHRTTLTAQVGGATNTGVTWSVNGIAGGNTSLGQICQVASNPCVLVTSGNTLQVDYIAPGAIPSPNPVSVQVTSAADITKQASAQITVINHVIVSVLPGNVTLAPRAVQGFTATVLGTSNQAVVWQVQGSGCATAGACGSIDGNGIYTAPDAAPAPNTLQVVAISSDDTSQSASASVTISSGANILTLHPASVYAGGTAGFTLRVEGSAFVASSPGPGSTLLIGGTARVTTCASDLQCTSPVAPADVAAAGSLSVQVQNPDNSKSNVVSLVVVAPNSSDEMISLTSASPAASGKDIVVVEPTTAGVSVPGANLDLNVAALGNFATATNTCALGGNPVLLARPASGTVTTDICIFSVSGLDTSMTYTITGPGDVAVISKQPAGLGIIHLTLQIPANAATGARTLFIQNTNLDKAAASGALEVR